MCIKRLTYFPLEGNIASVFTLPTHMALLLSATQCYVLIMNLIFLHTQTSKIPYDLVRYVARNKQAMTPIIMFAF